MNPPTTEYKYTHTIIHFSIFKLERLLQIDLLHTLVNWFSVQQFLESGGHLIIGALSYNQVRFYSDFRIFLTIFQNIQSSIGELNNYV